MPNLKRFTLFKDQPEINKEFDYLISQLKHGDNVQNTVKKFLVNSPDLRKLKSALPAAQTVDLGANLEAGSETLVIRTENRIFTISMTEVT